MNAGAGFASIGERSFKRKEEIQNPNQEVATFVAPETFSIVSNHDLTVKYFNNFFRKICNKTNRKIYCDLSQVKTLSIDSVMYLIAVIKNGKRVKGHKLHVEGNSPADIDAGKLLQESGFYSFVRAKSKGFIVPTNEKILQIRYGCDVNTKILKVICDFVNKACNTKKKFTRPLYNIIGELMSNTVQHAYLDNKRGKVLDHWYIFIENRENILRFVFLDTGDGIPQTIKKKLIKDILMDDSEFILSALRGELRTRTRETFRGKGLPGIYARCKSGFISNFIIVSGNGACLLNEEMPLRTMGERIRGTLFSWEIDKTRIDGEFLL